MCRHKAAQPTRGIFPLAYETLSDEDQRREYDTYGPEGQTSGGGRTSGGGGGGAGGFGGGQGAGPGGFHFNFGGGSGGNFQRSSGRSRGAGGQRWKPKDFGDINVDDVLRSFFGGEAGAGAGAGGSGFRFTSSSGGSGADDNDSLFDSLFKDFSFGELLCVWLVVAAKAESSVATGRKSCIALIDLCFWLFLPAGSRKGSGGRGKTSGGGGGGSHIRTRTGPPSGPTGGRLFGMSDINGHGGMGKGLWLSNA